MPESTTTQLRGSMVALITPFRDGRVDFAALERLIAFQLSEGTDGLVLCGTTAESPTLTEDEQAAIVRHTVEQVKGRCPIIVGSGLNCTFKTLKLSEQACTLGADALMLVAPYYNKPTQHGLHAHFSAIAERVELPIILYNIPGRCGVEIAEQTIVDLYRDHDNIVAVKHATGSVEGAKSLHQACDIVILSGDDPLTCDLMDVGAAGVISVMANLAPAAIKQITSAMLAGDSATARRIHEHWLPLAKVLLELESNPMPIKTALALRGFVAEEFRLPMCKMTAEHRNVLSDALEPYEFASIPGGPGLPSEVVASR